jgi:hypothetical protein
MSDSPCDPTTRQSAVMVTVTQGIGKTILAIWAKTGYEKAFFFIFLYPCYLVNCCKLWNPKVTERSRLRYSIHQANEINHEFFVRHISYHRDELHHLYDDVLIVTARPALVDDFFFTVFIVIDSAQVPQCTHHPLLY